MKEFKLDILAFGAHPDDVELGCGGTIAKEISEGKNTFIYRDSKGEVSFRYVEVRLLDDDRFHGVDLDINETRTYLYERVLETLPTEKVSKMSEQQIQKLVASYQKNYQVTETKKSNQF